MTRKAFRFGAYVGAVYGVMAGRSYGWWGLPLLLGSLWLGNLIYDRYVAERVRP